MALRDEGDYLMEQGMAGGEAGYRTSDPACWKLGSRRTDARWFWATPRKGRRRVWEVKTGDPDDIPRDDINQLLVQVKEDEARYLRASVVGCLLVPLTTITEDAQAGCRAAWRWSKSTMPSHS